MPGGYGSSDHGTLAERRSVAASDPSTPRSPARHCRVDGEPSLLVEWRRGAVEWEGRVLTLVWCEDSGWATVERWLPAALITAV